MKPASPEELAQELRSLNGVIHTSLSQGTRPGRTRVQRLVQSIKELSACLPKLRSHARALEGELEGACQAQISPRIRMLNAIQSMLWALESEPSLVSRRHQLVS